VLCVDVAGLRGSFLACYAMHGFPYCVQATADYW